MKLIGSYVTAFICGVLLAFWESQNEKNFQPKNDKFIYYVTIGCFILIVMIFVIASIVDIF